MKLASKAFTLCLKAQQASCSTNGRDLLGMTIES